MLDHRDTGRGVRLPLLIAAGVVLVLLLAVVVVPRGRDDGPGAEPVTPPGSEPISPLDPALNAFTLTHHPPTDTYATALSGAELTVSTPATNAGGNTRVIFSRKSDRPAVDQTVCATWQSTTGSPWHQEGVALRLSTEGGVKKMVSVTKNVWASDFRFFNVHLLDTATAPNLVQLASFDMSAVVGPPDRIKPFPWQVCARTRGPTFEFRVVPGDTAATEPAWGDPVHTRSLQLPPTMVYAGVPGWWFGHLEKSSSVSIGMSVSTP